MIVDFMKENFCAIQILYCISIGVGMKNVKFMTIRRSHLFGKMDHNHVLIFVKTTPPNSFRQSQNMFSSIN